MEGWPFDCYIGSALLVNIPLFFVISKYFESIMTFLARLGLCLVSTSKRVDWMRIPELRIVEYKRNISKPINKRS